MTGFYTPTGTPATRANGRSQDIRTEFTAIGGGFSSVSTSLASLSTVAASVTGVSTSLAGVSTSLANVSTSTTGNSSSAASMATVLGNVSTSESSTVVRLTSVSTSLSAVSASLSAVSSTTSAVSSTLAAAGIPALAYVSTQTASGAGSVTFTGLVSGYDYLVVADGVSLDAGGSAVARLRLRNAGADDTGTNYTWASTRSSGGTVSGSAAGTQTYIDLAGGTSMGTGPSSLEVKILSPGASGSAKQIGWRTNINGGTTMTADAKYANTTAVDGLTIYPSTGTITGTFNLYKIARS